MNSMFITGIILFLIKKKKLNFFAKRKNVLIFFFNVFYVLTKEIIFKN